MRPHPRPGADRWALALLLIGPTAPGLAQGPLRLVRDIAPGSTPCPASSDPAYGVTLGNVALFGFGAAAGGLWRTDGTGAGTLLLRDYDGLHQVSRLVRLGSVVVFSGAGADGVEPWRSDGTPAGTFQLRDIFPGPGSAVDLWDGVPVALGASAVFAASDGVQGAQLWRTDGTTGGTVLVRSFAPTGAIPSGTQFGRAGNRAFFPVQTNATTELWCTDGTSAGTVLLGPLGYTFAPLGEAQGVLLFRFTDSQSGSEVWRSDGTAAGTWLLRDIRPGAGSSYPRGLTNLGGQFLFWADDGVSGMELWRTDGTTAGTTLVADIAPGPASGGGNTMLQPDFAVLGNRMLFAASDLNSGNELWITDGTAAGTTRVRDINPGPGSANIGRLRVDGPWVWFAADDGTTGRELWRSDGTAAGTNLVLDINPGSAESRPQAEAVLAGVLLFSADDGVRGRELWRSDGTAAGTWLVKDLARCPAAGSNPGEMLADPRGTGTLYFVANDGVTGLEPWRSDGTAAGTALIQDLVPGPGTRYPNQFLVLGDRILFLLGVTLWGTDGTAAGTAQVPLPCLVHIPLGILRGQLLFAGNDTTTAGLELWRTDGTAAGSSLVRDINPGLAWSAPRWSLVWRDVLWFSADDGTHGRELWRSDGTQAGTTLIADLEPGSSGSDPKGLVAVGDALLFAARTSAAGEELWQTDGTATGTRMVLELHPGPGSSNPSNPMVLGATLFFAADDGVHGVELWRSDGTAAGTALVADLNPGAIGSAPRQLSALGNLLLFVADDGTHGVELWRSDGTAAGTRMVVDLLPGIGSGLQDTQLFTMPGAGHALFVGTDGTTGREVWITDGTAAGTRVLELVPGAESPLPGRFARVGSNVFLLADDGTTGGELWALRAMALAAPYGDACGRTRWPRIAGAGGPPTPGNASFGVRVDGAPQSAPAGLFLGRRRVEAQLGGGCALAVDGIFLWILTLTDPTGAASITLPVPNDPALVGGRLFAQWAVAEAGGPLLGQGVLSSGLEIVVSDW